MMTEAPDRAEVRQRYLKRLGLTADKGNLTAALDRAHELRKFEIENYWKRSTYFWGFQLAAFAALAIARQAGTLDPLVLMIVAATGMVASVAAVMTAKGSKFWQRNWEFHVDMLEDEVEGRLHKTALVHPSGLAPSVSQTNERLLKSLAAGWVAAYAIGLILYANLDPAAPIAPSKIVISILLSAAGLGSAIYVALTPKSKLEGRSFWAQTMEPYKT